MWPLLGQPHSNGWPHTHEYSTTLTRLSELALKIKEEEEEEDVQLGKGEGGAGRSQGRRV